MKGIEVKYLESNELVERTDYEKAINELAKEASM